MYERLLTNPVRLAKLDAIDVLSDIKKNKESSINHAEFIRLHRTADALGFIGCTYTLAAQSVLSVPRKLAETGLTNVDAVEFEGVFEGYSQINHRQLEMAKDFGPIFLKFHAVTLLPDRDFLGEQVSFHAPVLAVDSIKETHN